jgi:hypothetical protein
MKLRSVVLGLLVSMGFFAAAGFRSCGRQKDGEPSEQPSLESPDPSEVTQAYWLAARRESVRCGQATVNRDQLQLRANAIKSLADGKVAWSELARNYADAAATNAEAVKEIAGLPQERVDPDAAACVTGLASFLTFQGALLRKSSGECAEMAALFSSILAEGDGFDWDGPKGKEYARREDELKARMKATVDNEGAAQKRLFAELTTKAGAASALAKRHGRRFPDLLGK